MTTRLKCCFFGLLLASMFASAQTWPGLFPWGNSSGGVVLVPPTNQFQATFTNAIPLGAGTNIQAGTIVFDSTTSLWTMVGENDSTGASGMGVLTNGTDPRNPLAWGYASNCNINLTTPHEIYYAGTWYLIGNNGGPALYSASSASGPWTSRGNSFSSATNSWEAGGTSEYCLMVRHDGTCYVAYEGNSTNGTTGYEQVGMASSSTLTGTYTRFAANPVFTTNNPYSAGNASDPWLLEVNGQCVLGAQVDINAAQGGAQKNLQTAVATSSNWATFTAIGVVIQTNSFAPNTIQAFRGGPPTQFKRQWVIAVNCSPNGLGIFAVPADSGSPNFVGIPSVVASDLSAAITWTNDVNSCASAELGTSVGNYSLTTNQEDWPSNYIHTVHFYGLTASTTYHVKCFATNIVGLKSFGTSQDISFTTTSTNTDFTTMARYLLTEGSGTTANDTSGSGNNGTLVNTPTWISGSGLTFTSASSQYVTCGTNCQMLSSNMTISCWTKSSTSSGFFGPFGKTVNATSNGRWGFFQFSGTFYGLFEDGNNNTASTSETPWIDNNWHHTVLAAERGTGGFSSLTVYRDGVPVVTNFIVAGTTSYSLNTPVFIGCFGDASGNPANYFTGSIDDCRAFNRCMSRYEILNFYNGGRQ